MVRNTKTSTAAVSVKQNGAVKIVHNRLLGGWYVVRGPHHTPISGRFNSKAEAEAWLRNRKNPSTTNRALVALRRKIKNYTYGLPDDQLNATEKRLVKQYPQFFENDRGYIKNVKSAAKRKNPVHYNNIVKKTKRVPIYAGMDFDYRGGTKNNKTRKVGYKIIETTYDVNPKHPSDAMIISEKVIKTVMSKNPTQRKQNATAQDFRNFQKVQANKLFEMFQGRPSDSRKRVLQSDLTPKHKSRLGYLVLMKVKHNGVTHDLKFDGDSFLTMDTRKNLHIVGKDARITNVKLPNPGQLNQLGDLIQIDYITAKNHIEGGETVRFWHQLGEVDKQHPKLFVDHEGFPHVIGGGYDIWDVGIVN